MWSRSRQKFHVIAETSIDIPRIELSDLGIQYEDYTIQLSGSLLLYSNGECYF